MILVSTRAIRCSAEVYLGKFWRVVLGIIPINLPEAGGPLNSPRFFLDRQLSSRGYHCCNLLLAGAQTTCESKAFGVNRRNYGRMSRTPKEPDGPGIVCSGMPTVPGPYEPYHGVIVREQNHVSARATAARTVAVRAKLKFLLFIAPCKGLLQAISVNRMPKPFRDFWSNFGAAQG
jgi:hypothetical protein